MAVSAILGILMASRPTHHMGQPWHLPEIKCAAVSWEAVALPATQGSWWGRVCDRELALAQADMPTCQGMFRGLMDRTLGPLPLEVQSEDQLLSITLELVRGADSQAPLRPRT